MQRNTETLSTRDLASPNEPPADITASDSRNEPPADITASDSRNETPADMAASEGDRRDVVASEGQSGVFDQAAPVGEATRLPVDEATAPSGEPRTAASATAHSIETSPLEEAPADSTGAAASASNGGSLLEADMDATFQQRWKEIQTRFVDEPRGAVEDADGLVANLMQQLAQGFAKERERLEAQWGRGEDISTEDLRVALQRYRTFFQRLLST